MRHAKPHSCILRVECIVFAFSDCTAHMTITLVSVYVRARAFNTRLGMVSTRRSEPRMSLITTRDSALDVSDLG